MKVVKIPKPEIEGMLKMLDGMRERVVAGEFETLWVLAFTPDRRMLSVERGVPRDRFFKIGQLEAFKQDLLNVMDTGEDIGDL